MREKTDKSIKNDLIKYTIPLIFIFSINLFFIGVNYKFWCPILSLKGAVVECLIIYVLCLLFWGISGKWKRTITFLGLSILSLSIINQIKYLFTSEPILLSDIFFLKDFEEITQIVNGELWNTIKLCLIPIIIEIIIFFIFIKIGRFFLKNEKKIEIRLRVILIIFSTIFFVNIFSPIEVINTFIKNEVFDIDDRKDYAAYTSISEYYLEYGIIGGMYGQMIENRLTKPKEYNEDEINKELANVEENNEKTLGIPNVIVVFSESFWDIDQLDEVEFNTKITENFNKLKENGLFFNMISPSYGGISANVEYEFLTGSNTMFFNRAYIPYMQLYNNDTYYNRPSIIKELKNNGYRTKIVTYTSSNLFDCGRAYKYMQVDDIEHNIETDENYTKGKYVSDEYVVNKIIDEFKNKNKNEKLFYMTLTMQAHMPYSKDKYDQYDVWVTQSDLTSKENEVLTSYAQRNI